MSTFKAIVPLVVSLCIIATWSTSSAQDADVAPLDPVARQEIIRELDLMPQLDAETRKLCLERIEKAHKLNVEIDNIAVYSNGIVSRFRITSKHTSDFRLNHQGRGLGFGRLTDERGNTWGLPPMNALIHFRWPVDEDTYLIRSGETVRAQHVDKLQSPKLVRLVPRAEAPQKPKTLFYNKRGWEQLYSLEFKSLPSAYVTGRGSTSVQWFDEPVPAKLRSEVITELKS